MGDATNSQLQAAIEGDRAALEQLLAQVGAEIRQTLSISDKWQSVLDRDDVMQVSYMEAFMRIGKFSGESVDAFRAWLRQIAQNNLRDAIKGLERDKRPPPGKRIEPQSSEKTYVALYEMIGTMSGTPSRVAAANEIRHVIDQSLAKLPPDYAQVIRLFDIEGLNGPEVGKKINRSRGAAFMLLARARERLADIIGTESQYF